tara:strand:+ start:13 stop:330 length:318 start_codon:yes stop_codon:yes gene_type:complete
MPLPNLKDVEKALEFLSETDDKYAEAYAKDSLSKEWTKVVKYENLPEDGTILSREAEAYSSENYKQALREEEQKRYNKKKLELQMENATLVIEVWRSLNANQRRS